MKNIYLLLMLIFFTSNLFSQAWIKNLPQSKPKSALTFFDYKNAFNQYWTPLNVNKGVYMKNGIQTKAVGWKQFKRWEYYMESQINPTTGEMPKQTAQQVYDEYLKINPSYKSANATTSSSWTALGPNSSGGGYAGVGRINCIAFHPSDINTYWVGAASGGLWVTTNNGSSWTCLTDNNNVLAISDIVIPTDYATSKTIYIATGDRDGWDNRSIGVLKSVNGGSTWNSTGISYALSDGRMVYKLLLDPNNNQAIIAATTNGVYKNTNGGTTWGTKLTSISFRDMEYKPGDFNTLYGSTNDGKIYVTSDGGGTWTLAFSDANAFRIELAISSNQPDLVYAIASNTIDGLYGIYKSTNSGSDYTQMFSGTTKNLLGWVSDGSDTGGQGSYDLCIAVSQSDANTVLIGGVNTWRSVDGGTSWSIVNHWVGGGGAQEVHADKHNLLFRSNGDLFECNDGGVYISSDNGAVWTDKSNGLLISQMYKLGISNTVSNEVITGLQDNGTKLLAGDTWKDVVSGDGMECLIDYTDKNVQYGSSQYGDISRTTDHWVSDFTNIQPSGAGNGAFVTPYIIDPTNNQTLYAGYADVWKTTNRGDSWTKISNINASGKIRSMAIAPSNNQVLFVVELFKFWKTTNGGTTWTDITGTLPLPELLGDITSVAIKNDDANTLWVTMGYYNTNRVFQSIDGGITWTNISSGLPPLPAYSIIQNKQSTDQVQLYVGTELGVYFKNGANNWVLYNTGLPNVKIGEIEIYYAPNPQDSKLRAATYGRGLWESPVYYDVSAPMTYVSSTTTQNNATSINPNHLDQEILGVQIVMNGNLTPLSATSFTFNTVGSTNPTTDISNAKLYSGTSRLFETATQFGTTANSVNGSFTFTGNKTLTDGTNYFWLTYDVPLTATLNDYLDAQCTSLTVGTAKTPTVTNPSGNRQIALSYCSAGGSINPLSKYITRVRLNTIDQTSSWGTSGYEDYTSQIATIQIGENSTLTINVSSDSNKDSVLVWVDWNRDGDFTGPGECIYHSPASAYSYSTSFSPPYGATLGPTGMRIRFTNNSYQPNSTPCGNSWYGEVEDYTINVTAGCTPPTTQATGFTSSALANNSMTLSWARGNGNAVLVVAKADNAVNSDPVNGTTYTANAAFGSGTQVGTGNYVVYNGTSTSVNLTALATGTGYYYAIYEYNQATNCYLKPALTGNATTTGTSYCTAGSTGNSEYISNVKIGGINQASGKGANGYQDFTSQIATVQIGTNTSAIINVTTPYVSDQILIWIDWNGDGDFNDAGENVYASTGNFTSPHTTSNFTPPVGAVIGTTRMRIRLHDTNSSGANATPCGDASWGEVEDYTINVTAACISPSAPIVGTITQPTCAVATGSVVLNGLPATGTWTLTRTPGGITTTGTGVSSTITGLIAGTYTYTVTNEQRCTSLASTNVVINTLITNPTAPTIGTITQPTCIVATGSVVLNGLPATGNWTLTRTPDGVTTTGTGVSKTITGLLTGTYTYTVTNGSGCVSVSSANVVINTQPTLIVPTSSAATNLLQISFTANWNTTVTVMGFILDVATDNSFTTFVSGYNSKDIGNVTSSSITGLSANTNYYYRVRAYNLCGTSINSGTITATTLPNPPVAPVSTTATSIVQTSCTANWGSLATATGYKLDVSTDNSFTTFVSGYNSKDIGNVTSSEIIGLSANTTYYYRVRAYNTGGDSPNSNTITLTTLPNPPVAPVSTAATSIVQTSCTANWGSSATATGYKLDVATDNSFTTFVSGYNSKDIGNVTSYNVTGLIANTTYYYRVRAYNTGGDSPNSNTITLTTLPNPPVAPVSTAATSIVQTSCTANWGSSATATGYKLDVATDNSFTTFVSGYNSKDIGNVTSYNVTGLIANTTYYYRVRGYNTGGDGNYSNTITLTTLPNPPVAPVSTAATSIVQTSCTANWGSSVTAMGYKLEVATDNSFTTFVSGYNSKDIGNVTSSSVTGLIANTTYYYRVIAYNTGGNSPYSNTITLTTLPNPPVAPVSTLATSIVQTSCTTNWGSSSTATGYKLDLATDNAFTTFVTGYNSKDIGNVTSSGITGLIANTTYYYRVKAYNTGGDSPNSNTITFTTLPNPPSAPTANTANSIVQTSFTARWNSSNTATGYRIDIATNSSFTTYLSGFNDKDVGNVLTIIVTGLSAKTSYYYRVRAYNTGGTSSSSSTITVTTLTNPPAAPLSLTSSSCNDLVTLKWKKSTGPDVIRYRIYGGTSANPSIKIDSTTSSASDTVKNIIGLTRGLVYYFRVTAVNYDGPESVFSSQVSEKVKRGVVPAIKTKWGDLLICPNVGDSIVSYQWFKNNVAISNATSQNYLTNKQPGAYMVETTDRNGCKNISNVVTITGSKSLSVYPNPTSRTFALKINDVTEGRANVTIINSSGIKVMELQAESPNDDLLKEISVRDLTPGIYIVKVLLDNEELYYTKIVVTK